MQSGAISRGPKADPSADPRTSVRLENDRMLLGDDRIGLGSEVDRVVS